MCCKRLASGPLRCASLGALVLALSAGGARSAVAGGHGHAPAHAEEEDDRFASDAKIRGVNLGQYRIRAYYPVEAQKSTVRFELHAAVASENLAEARTVLEHRLHKLRDEVITVTRMTPLVVFDDPQLEDFRRRILVRLRRMLPELPIDDVFVSDFRLTVKSL